jgi:hypothetical protein
MKNNEQIGLTVETYGILLSLFKASDSRRDPQFVRVSPCRAPGSYHPRGPFLLAHSHGEGLAIRAGQPATLAIAASRA